MRRPVLALALLTAAPLVAAVGGTGFPDDELIVRDCYGGEEDLNLQLQQQFGGAPGGVGGTVAATPPSAPSQGQVLAVKGKGKGGGGGKAKSSPKTAAASNSMQPPPTPPAEPAPEASQNSTSEVLTKDFLSKLPTGRSYQSAVGVSAGVTGGGGNTSGDAEAGEAANPNVAGGATNENTYRLDGANVTDDAKPREEAARKEAQSRAKAEAEAHRKVEEERRATRTADADVGGDAVASAEADRRHAEEQARRAREAAAAAAAAAERAAQAAAEARERESLARQARSALDWGARIFLSNDDSMSLASAQRVIYALQHGLSVPTEHIRPHELLNYFSFDVAEPSNSQLFDVHASAVRDGDQMSVALAVKGASPEPLPLDLTVIVDQSCSMESEGRMAYTQRGLQQMTGNLKRGDRVDLVLFSNSTCTPVENFVVGRDDMAILEREISRIRPTGGTNLDAGLKEGYRVATGHVDTHGRNRRVMLLTDAELNQGDVNPHTVSEIGTSFDDHNIRLTGIGVGRSFRDDVLDRLTEKGKGAYVFLGSEGVVDRVFGSGFDSLVQTIAHDVQFQLDLPENLAMERFYGEEASTVAADIQPIHYYAGTSQVFLQDLAVKAGRLDERQPVTLTISYREADTGEPAKRVFRTTIGQMLDSDSHNVTKAKALMAWTDLLQTRSMGGDPCGEPLHDYMDYARALTDDAEVAFVNNLVEGVCGELPLATSVAAAPLKVRVDSDQPISHVALACPGVSASESLSGSDTIARFNASPGECTVTLGGVVDMRVTVDVPETGRDLRCTVRGGRVHCG